ncbi:hypothetical protein HFMG06CAA_0537 [Mycoplasmoides gallisepticum CA06_2006.052-5-2P]|uniref:hypothetical protein n=1 Tax=Mycoplasmoides gallisepticum TaxID=2096 RepID=UPI0002778ED5|nr:hypothetical protein [Mycoplasmoides gallisepticum]AFP80254.1 hypothetical protein HFMG06CAA_0537 [Mycoplasmoides gallisepticum CA06_2006.052-5-2P]
MLFPVFWHILIRMKKAYLLLSALTLPLTSFQGGFSYKATVNEFKLVNHNSNNSTVSLTTRSSPVNLTFTLNPDRSKNTVESIKEQIVNLADQQFQKYFKEVQSWIDEFKEEFRQLYQIDSVEYVESRLYNIDRDTRSFQDILDNSWFVRSNDERTDKSRSAYGEINNFGTYSDSNSANYDFAGKYNPTFKSYVEIIHNYSRVTKQIEIPKYDVKKLPLSDLQLTNGFVKYKANRSLNGAFDPIPNANNQYYAFTNVDISSDKFTIREKKYTGWEPTLSDLNTNFEKRKNLTSVKLLRWKIHPVDAATYERFTIKPNKNIFPDASNYTEYNKRRLFFWKQPSGNWRIVNDRDLVNATNNWYYGSGYRIIQTRPQDFDRLYNLKDSQKTLNINIDQRSKLISSKYNIFADYFVLPDNFTYKTLNFNITNKTVFNGYRNLINLFLNNLKLVNDAIELRDNYIYSKVDSNLQFRFWYNDRLIKLIDHIRKIRKYTVNSTQNKYKNLALDYADITSLERNTSKEFFNNLIGGKGRNYVSNFQRELFYFLGITTNEIDDYQYNFIISLPQLFDDFNRTTKLVADIYVGSNKISDRILISNNDIKMIDINLEEIRNQIPQLDSNRNRLQLKLDNLRFVSQEIDDNNGKISNFLNIQNDHLIFKIDDVSVKLNLNYRYDFLNIKYKNSIAQLNDFNVNTFEPLYASDFNHKIGVERSLNISDILIDSYKSIYLNSNSIYINQDGVYSPDQGIWTGHDLTIMSRLADRYSLNFVPNDVTGEFWSIIRVLNGNDFAIPGTEMNPELIPNRLYFLKNDENFKAKFYLVKFKAFNKVIDVNKSRVSFDHEIVPIIKLNYLNNDFEIRLLTDYDNNLLSDQTINLRINQEFSIRKEDSMKLIKVIEPVLAASGLRILNNSIEVNERANQLNFTLYSLDKIEKTAFNPITNFDLVFEKENNNIFKIIGKFDNNTIFNLNYQVTILDDKITLELLTPDLWNLTPVIISKAKITELIKNELNKYNLTVRSWDNFDLANKTNEIELINTSASSFDENEGDIPREEILRNNQQNDQVPTKDNATSNNHQKDKIETKEASSISFDLSDKRNLIIFIVSVSLISLGIIGGVGYGIIKLMKKNKRKVQK